MGADGTVPEGHVSKDLLEDDADAAFGVRLDNDIVADAFADAWKPKSVVLVEASDLVVPTRTATWSRLDQRAQVLTHALRASDVLVGRLLDSVDPRATRSVVVGPAASSSGGVLTIAAVRAPGFDPGLLGRAPRNAPATSSSWTWVPRVLELLEVHGPTRSAGVRSKWATRAVARPTGDFLVDGNDASTFRVRIVNAVPNVYVASRVVLAVARSSCCGASVPTAALPRAVVRVVLLAISRRCTWHGRSRSRTWARRVLGVPRAVLRHARRAVPRRARWPGHRRGDDRARRVVRVLVVDVVLGNPLQFNSALGFSPSVAGRFIGFGERRVRRARAPH